MIDVESRQCWPNEGAAANRRPAGQSDGSCQSRRGRIAADRAFPAAVAELDR